MYLCRHIMRHTLLLYAAMLALTVGCEAEMLPLARRMIELLDDYEQHPGQYHDGTYRKPPADKREDYIRFYRSQAGNFIIVYFCGLNSPRRGAV